MTNEGYRARPNYRKFVTLPIIPKVPRGLYEQMMLYFANFNYCREHLPLRYEDESGMTEFDCPAKRAGLIDHVWSLSELLTYPYYKTKTY